MYTVLVTYIDRRLESNIGFQSPAFQIKQHLKKVVQVKSLAEISDLFTEMVDMEILENPDVSQQ